MRVAVHVRWACDGWQGRADLAVGVAPADALLATETGEERRSRHAATRRLEVRGVQMWLKTYAAPGGRRALRAWRMGLALAAAGFRVPEGVVVGTRDGAGLLVTRDAGGRPLADVLAGAARGDRRRLATALGDLVANLHASGFVHGDLVPSNVLVRDGGEFVLLDHDRTRHGRPLVWWGAQRNLVQLGRFVIPGVGLTDRARVLAAYARRLGLGRRQRHRLARRVVAKTVARRCAIDGIRRTDAVRAGFAALMRSDGPFDPARSGTRRA